MRQIVLDTETTGLEASQGHRIIEIGCVELVNRRLTGNHYHQYINPRREIDQGAIEVHGITSDFLADKPEFEQVAREFVEFIAGAELVIFPELSLTGYEPDLAAELAVAADGSALQPLRDAARSGNLTVAAGCPIAAGQQKPWLSAVVFGPDIDCEGLVVRFDDRKAEDMVQRKPGFLGFFLEVIEAGHQVDFAPIAQNLQFL